MSELVFDEQLVGRETGRAAIAVTARMSASYACAIGDERAQYLDDRQPAQQIAHPLLAAVLPQRLAMGLPERLISFGIAPAVFAATLHYDESITYSAPIPLGCTLDIREQIARVVQKRAGAHLLLHYRGLARDTLVFETQMGLILRGVRAHRADGAQDGEQPRAASQCLWRNEIFIDRSLPYVYDACSDVVYPIHTSRAAAAKAGFPDIVLQGTATLALAVREILRRVEGSDARQLVALRASFRAVVHVESTIAVELMAEQRSQHVRRLHFRVRNERDEAVIEDGLLVLREDA